MLLKRQLEIGSIWGTIYTFEKAGDIFPVHVHDEQTNHITILAFGGVGCIGHPKFEGTEIHAQAGGTVIDWIAGEPHGFVALTDGATLINLRKMPQ